VARRTFVFKCHDCGTEFDCEADHTQVASGFVPACPECDTDSSVKRVWTFGQFTFKGGLPSNFGRDGVWR